MYEPPKIASQNRKTSGRSHKFISTTIQEHITKIDFNDTINDVSL